MTKYNSQNDSTKLECVYIIKSLGNIKYIFTMTLQKNINKYM